jgi:uncharacterized Tic20 family protein
LLFSYRLKHVNNVVSCLPLTAMQPHAWPNPTLACVVVVIVVVVVVVVSVGIVVVAVVVGGVAVAVGVLVLLLLLKLFCEILSETRSYNPAVLSP